MKTLNPDEMDADEKVEFLYHSDEFGRSTMAATTWPGAVSELYKSGIYKSGQHKIVKRTYKWISDEPQIINMGSE